MSVLVVPPPSTAASHKTDAAQARARVGEHRYFDCSITAAINPTGNGRVLTEALINQTSTIPYLGFPDQYEVGVVSMRIPLFNVPLFIFEDGIYNVGFFLIDSTQNGATSNFHVATVQYDGESTGDSHFVPASYQDSSVPAPLNRAVFYPRHFAAMVNNAMRAAWSQIATLPQLPPWNDVLGNLTPDDVPYFSVGEYGFGSDSMALSLPVRSDGYCPFYNCNSMVGPFPEPVGNRYQLIMGMSASLYRFFAGIESTTFLNGSFTGNTTGLPLHFAFPFVFGPENFRDIKYPYPSPGTTKTRVIITGNVGSGIAAFEQVSRLVVVSNLPIANEPLATSANIDGRPTSYNVLTSFVLPADGITRDIAYLGADAIPKYHEVTVPSPLSNIMIQIFYEIPKYGLLPLFLSEGAFLSVRLHFRRRKNPALFRNGVPGPTAEELEMTRILGRPLGPRERALVEVDGATGRERRGLPMPATAAEKGKGSSGGSKKRARPARGKLAHLL